MHYAILFTYPVILITLAVSANALTTLLAEPSPDKINPGITKTNPASAVIDISI
jgi:hypothetical protein